ncbi:iron uptake transporter deferrochelatase/peroxidase subunit [Corynebacterium sp. CCM 9186]|uniref:iron uptake transporter deferrochelatase/peroxidase subunit n=1 Tax=Corynebacterium meridianum TaxID=2765363 RepID=UPI002005FBCD|nr:iron uptake transporter deferrochelatase/peroxidase subunit [Corynebacterium meridianum]MCK7677118.1 iron uptake transporter deferrochelatase/peroxidase subunit [Corynebacterium meridianum]
MSGDKKDRKNTGGRPLSRRGFLAGAGIGAGLGAAGAVGAGRFLGAPDGEPAGGEDTQIVPFNGEHQSGITTTQQERMYFVALNVVTDSRDELRDLLRRWTAMARRMSQGLEAEPDGSVGVERNAVATDTGEAVGLRPARLTVTVGFGPSLFDDRFGLAAARPEELEDLPHFAGDQIIEEISRGDLCIQACADDPQVAVHAARVLTKAGSGLVTVKWAQLGFGRTASTSITQGTPRNLFGFKDGTANLKNEYTNLINEHVWVHDGSWMDGGSYLCVRRIRMLLENWDRQTRREQEEVFGRTKDEGAPIGREREEDPMPFSEWHGTDGPLIPAHAHSRLASAPANDGARMLRRGYNFVGGVDEYGHLDAGLFFLAFVASPWDDFIAVQSNLSHHDNMNEFVRYESSAIFACPPGLADDEDWWGRGLFERTA